MHELRTYLQMLLDHQCGSAGADCRECHSLQQVYRFMQTELFSTVIYTETPLARQSPQTQPPSVNRAAAGPRQPHAA